jgi:hypothetical protein
MKNNSIVPLVILTVFVLSLIVPLQSALGLTTQVSERTTPPPLLSIFSTRIIPIFDPTDSTIS